MFTSIYIFDLTKGLEEKILSKRFPKIKITSKTKSSKSFGAVSHNFKET